MGLFDKIKTTTRVETKVIDASDNPQLQKEILDVLEAAGVTAEAGAGQPDSGGDDVISQLERLKTLKDSGALSDAEFQAAKAKILAP